MSSVLLSTVIIFLAVIAIQCRLKDLEAEGKDKMGDWQFWSATGFASIAGMIILVKALSAGRRPARA